MERDAAQPAAAAIAYQRALALEPANVTAQYGLARISLERGEADAVPRFATLANIAPDDRDIAIGEAEARELAGEPGAHERVAKLLAQQPEWREGHALLGRMLWEAGDPDFDKPLRSAISATPQSATLHDALIELLAGVDRFAEAAEVAAEAARITGDSRFLLAEAAHVGSMGDTARAETIFADLPADLPDRALHEARHRTRLNQFDTAQALLEPIVARAPGAVPAWALLGALWRKTGDSRAEWLHGQPGLIREHELAVIPQEIEQIAGWLRTLHHQMYHPVGQSMRGGTQTRGRLFSRLEPTVNRLREIIGNAVLEHWHGLPAFDARHPLLRHRNAAPTLSGVWSVRLTGGGHHVSHIHPEGLLSSASYWIVPPSGNGTDGWLEIGRAPANLKLDLEPIATFAPKPGMLMLFPSTIFHGTRPFSAGERITVAFDIATN